MDLFAFATRWAARIFPMVQDTAAPVVSAPAARAGSSWKDRTHPPSIARRAQVTRRQRTNAQEKFRT
ncbi:hypothetical protein BRN43_03625 [Xanthomonas oryzae pv. oryzae]|nr:hypothetical protein BRN37_10150 [Xanthomonas oryzae pv. oryzae]RBC42300.1 hypothetical protein BRN41_14035 [Xanthomonas oryzae pv. oryzae]RBC43061.1 hypothetical protein BRN17_07635 [Xanthomonas oryzae pv. oryzae]RBC53461.1 hypothetical protein BRN44_14545 [Xanthomonas oryzae pv. oryzae]RBC87889.1 hypothetical protein BRM96_01560 [Xanthomonas oryzae pv. oryzae]